MAHQIYQTEGIVLRKKNFGEADCFFYLLTEKFGMIKAAAKGARLEKSKLRGSLDLFSFVNLALISSKDFWKIVDATEKEKTDKSGAGYFDRIKIFAELANFLIRMIKGEERDYFIWREVKNFLFALHNDGVGVREFRNLQIQTTARVLNNLGYMESIPTATRQTVFAINKAIRESML